MFHILFLQSTPSSLSSFVLDDNRENINDQAKLIVGIVVGLLLAAMVAGVAYWLCMKKSK